MCITSFFAKRVTREVMHAEVLQIPTFGFHYVVQVSCDFVFGFVFESNAPCLYHFQKLLFDIFSISSLGKCVQ